MIVFEYFFEKMQDVFAQLIDKRANEEYLDAWLEVDDVMVMVLKDIFFQEFHRLIH